MSTTNLKAKFSKKSIIELQSMLTAQLGVFTQVSIKVATNLLSERGLHNSRVDLYKEKFRSYPDDKLVEVIEMSTENYSISVRQLILDELSKRGFEIEHKEVDEPDKRKINYTPIFLAIVLLAIRIFLFPSTTELFYEDVGDWFFYIALVMIVEIGLVIYYRKKQSRKYIAIWGIVGFIFGAWILLIVGVIELFVSKNIDEPEINDGID